MSLNPVFKLHNTTKQEIKTLASWAVAVAILIPAHFGRMSLSNLGKLEFSHSQCLIANAKSFGSFQCCSINDDEVRITRLISKSWYASVWTQGKLTTIIYTIYTFIKHSLMMANDDQSFTFALGACLRPAIFVTAQQKDANKCCSCCNYGNYCTVYVYKGVVVQKDSKETKCVFDHVRLCLWICWYFVSVYACAVLCLSPPCECKFGSSRARSGATTCHGSGPSWSFGFLCFLLSNGSLKAGTSLIHTKITSLVHIHHLRT